jgi:hypothetical protein
MAKKKAVKEEVNEVNLTQEVASDVKEKGVSRIKADVKNLQQPLAWCVVSESELSKNPDIYFTDREQAKRYAQNELLSVKESVSVGDYTDAYWRIELFV